MGLYLKIDGIDGNATHETHKNWINIAAIDFNISRYITSNTGAVSNREGVQPAFSDLHISKYYDKSSIKLKQMASSGMPSKKTIIHFVTTGDPGETYLEITLNNTLLSNYTLSGGVDQMPQEQIALNFTDIEWKFTEYDQNNKAQSPLVAGYDLATCKVK